VVGPQLAYDADGDPIWKTETITHEDGTTEEVPKLDADGNPIQANTVGDDMSTIYVNGTEDHTREDNIDMVGSRKNFDGYRTYFGHMGSGGEKQGEDNHFRLGSCSRIGDSPRIAPGTVEAYRGNFPADATIDEFHVWDSWNDEMGPRGWHKGRYYKPINSEEERTFVSGPIQLRTRPFRSLAPPSAETPTGGMTPPKTNAVKASDEQIRVLGAAWTWYGGGYDSEWNRVLRDWDVPIYNMNPIDRMIDLQIWFEVDGVEYGPLVNDRYSEISDIGVLVPEEGEFRYKARFVLDPGITVSSVLVDTPVLDDVTIFYTIGYPEVLEYWLDLRQIGG
jgi:hypothetical protein